MEQTEMERTKAISTRQKEAMEGIIQSKEFSLAECRKLKEVLAHGVSTRREASVFLEYCYASVRFQRCFNRHQQRAQVACCVCKSRDNVGRALSLETGRKAWCCAACLGMGVDPSLVAAPKRQGSLRTNQKKQEVQRIRSLATTILMMADDVSMGVVPRYVAKMVEEIRERANKLLMGKAETEPGQRTADAARVVVPLAATWVSGDERVEHGM